MMEQGTRALLLSLYEKTEKGEGEELCLLDAAAVLQTTPSAVHRRSRLLAEQGALVLLRYGFVRLTEKGKAEGARLARRRRTVVRFLSRLRQCSEAETEAEAVRIEGILGEKTLEAMERFLLTPVCGEDTARVRWGEKE